MLVSQTLIQEIEARGASIRIDGQALKVANDHALTDEICAEIRAHKAELLELLSHDNSFTETAKEGWDTPLPISPFRRANDFVFVPATIQTAPGAVMICAALQSFRLLFAAARKGEVSTAPLDIEIAGESHRLENVTETVLDIEIAWTDAVRRCQREKRNLTEIEAAVLKAAAALLNHV